MTTQTTSTSTTARWSCRTYAVLLGLVGILLVAGGVVLAVDGGSPYYLLAGLAVAASAVLVWRRDPRGPWLFAAMLVGTIAWSVWEVGFEPWGLMARLLAPFVLGLATDTGSRRYRSGRDHHLSSTYALP